MEGDKGRLRHGTGGADGGIVGVSALGVPRRTDGEATRSEECRSESAEESSEREIKRGRGKSGYR